MTDFPNPTQAAPAATPTAEPAPTQTSTVQPSGQANGVQGAPTEETFTKLDVNTLPPQLKQAYDSMLRDYKTKTTEIAEQRKKYDGYDAYKQKAELLEKLQTNQDFVRMWNEHVQRTGQAPKAGDPANTSKLEQKLQEIEAKLQQSEVEGMVKTFREMKDEKGEPMNPDFDALQGIDLGTTANGDKYNLMRACVELAQGNTDQEKLANGYKAAKAIRDQIFEEGRKHGMGKMLTRVRQSTEAPGGVSTDKTTISKDDAKNLSVKEARELAQKGVVVR